MNKVIVSLIILLILSITPEFYKQSKDNIYKIIM